MTAEEIEIEALIEGATEWMTVRMAIEQSGETQEPELEICDLREPVQSYPRWTSGLLDYRNGAWEDAVRFQGLTVLGGEYGTGKSTLSMSCALQNAYEGSLVIVLDAENGRGLATQRVLRWHDNRLAPFDQISGRNFHWVRVRKGNTMRQIFERVRDLHAKYPGPILFVMDSINKIAKLTKRPKESIFEKLDEILNWMDQVSQDTHGQIRFLALSQLNKAKEIWGQEALYTAPMVMTLHHAPEFGKDAVRIHVAKNRDGEQDYDVGLFNRLWARGRFQRIGTQ